ncbi:MAG: type II toxin-antitoxin system RelE/ParE family toxin [Pseudomonadota bacterium]
MQYKLSNVAAEELETILNDIHAVNPQAAFKYARIFKDTFRFLTENPFAAAISEEDSDVHVWSIPNTLYSIPYCVVNDEIHILSIFYQRRDHPKSWKEFSD